MQRDFGPAEKPLWPLSSYGVGKYEPSFLSGLDISPEELRVRAVEALKEGKGAEYVSNSHLNPFQTIDVHFIESIRSQCHSERQRPVCSCHQRWKGRV
jgi:hypothetical protein